MTFYIRNSILALSLMAGLTLANNQVAIVYNGQSSVNTDAIHFLEEQMSESGSGLKLVPIKLGQPVQVAQYRAVVVLNTGIPQGIDRNLAQFIQGVADKTRLILLSLRSGNAPVRVDVFAASPQTLGLDGVTAASTYQGKGIKAMFGGSNSPEFDMHISWAQKIMALIQKRK